MGEAEPGRFGQPPLDARDASDLAREADFADGDQVFRQGVSLAALARASATARSAAGSVSFTPPTVAL